ncbi:cysteine desulfurase family protein [Cardinium endosymbiont of Culicoides punctatus]|uniref:cysteine desulfurase family protein n=1 Tax=Cardinium endosymbiont of Culicoides punctatus TaxID=2304601 RepID=UPI001058578A|nr:cysteine desulfurase family protein [Cardinium endosymbiont of Culicoides punctatus]TDG95177.1 Cysteine desulfurase IscS [Cardinium endosymbiont of Culicoides punctatus]
MDLYLDNAATTSLDPEVLESMMPYMINFCGNPSSIHRHGCRAKAAIEKSRKKIASLFQVTPSEILFTSGGTEGNNMLLTGVVEGMKISHVLTSPLEHLSVRMPLERLANQGKITLTYTSVTNTGDIILEEVESWLQNHNHALVSFMQVNHEIGNIIDLQKVSKLCQQHNALLHSDTIQSIYCLSDNFSDPLVQLAVGSAHKIHGPKGIGFVYVDSKISSITPLIYGGSQELNMRGGTENVASIIGMAKALEITFRDRLKIADHLVTIKKYMIALLKKQIPNIVFNGNSESLIQSSPTMLNISLPSLDHKDMLIYNLDIHGISASTGSACTSGSNIGSQVITALQKGDSHAIRFSFSKHTTHLEIEKTVEVLTKLYQKGNLQ